MNKLSFPIFIGASLYIVLLSTFFIYWSGLDSAFILDDIVNLKTIGQYQHLGYWHDFLLFLLNGDSGPTGRPISLASFYLNDSVWIGAEPFDFKYTNLLLHLLNGILIFFFIHKIVQLSKLESHYHVWLSLLTTTLWLITPLNTTTVLYVVQRMTELATLFTLLSLIFYLFLRKKIIQQQYKKTLTYLIFFILNFGLAILSKENGILISVYILTLEYTVFKNHTQNDILRKINIIFGWLPLSLIILFLFKAGFIDSHDRSYSTGERLLTESRILWDYLFQVVTPNSSYISLLHDDFVISSSIFKPFTTLFSSLGIIFLITSAFKYRVKAPIFAFGIFWFFGGHILESTTVALELYFEHRNYLPMLGVMIIVAYYSLKLIQQEKYKYIISSFLAIYIIILGFSTYNLSLKWTKPIEMISAWLEKHPESQRTLEALDYLVGEKISKVDRQKILTLLDKRAKASNTGSYLIFRNLTIQCEQNTIKLNDLQSAINQLKQSGFVLATPSVFAGFLNTWSNTNCGALSTDALSQFIRDIQKITHLQKSTFPHTLAYWQGEVQVRQGNLEQAIKAFEASYQLQKDLDLLLLQAMYLHTAGLDEAAEKKLQQASNDLCNNWRQCWILKLRQGDIDEIRRQLTTVQIKANNNEQVVHHSTSEERS
jgi:tetratricopeptide (TPR) repeat protein